MRSEKGRDENRTEEQRGKSRARKGKKEERRGEEERREEIENREAERAKTRPADRASRKSSPEAACHRFALLSFSLDRTVSNPWTPPPLPPARRVSNESRSPVSRSHSPNLRLSNSTIPRTPSTFSRPDSIQTSETFRCLSIPAALSDILSSVLDERVPGSAFKPWSKKVARWEGGGSDARSIFRHEVDSYV